MLKCHKGTLSFANQKVAIAPLLLTGIPRDCAFCHKMGDMVLIRNPNGHFSGVLPTRTLLRFLGGN